MTSLSIISGGQTGVDRGALDAAIMWGVPYGGSCPKGRRAEDGVIPHHYQLTELDSPDYIKRTKLNVQLSDGTLILVPLNELTGGTARTYLYAHDQLEKPARIVAHSDCGENFVDQVARTDWWLSEHDIQILNVAGPRASKWPDAHLFTTVFLSALLAIRGVS